METAGAAVFWGLPSRWETSGNIEERRATRGQRFTLGPGPIRAPGRDAHGPGPEALAAHSRCASRAGGQEPPSMPGGRGGPCTRLAAVWGYLGSLSGWSL